jgi:hypothetical protein
VRCEKEKKRTNWLKLGGQQADLLFSLFSLFFIFFLFAHKRTQKIEPRCWVIKAVKKGVYVFLVFLKGGGE